MLVKFSRLVVSKLGGYKMPNEVAQDIHRSLLEVDYLGDGKTEFILTLSIVGCSFRDEVLEHTLKHGDIYYLKPLDGTDLAMRVAPYSKLTDTYKLARNGKMVSMVSESDKYTEKLNFIMRHKEDEEEVEVLYVYASERDILVLESDNKMTEDVDKYALAYKDEGPFEHSTYCA